MQRELLHMSISRSLTIVSVLALGAAVHDARAQTAVVVGDASPATTEAPGARYAYEGGVLTLSVATTGPLFCGNPLLPGQTPQFPSVRLAPEFSSWILPVATDVATVDYGSDGNVMRINTPPTATSLTCYGASAAGWPLTPYRNGLFYEGFEFVLPADPYTGEKAVASATGIDTQGADGPRMLTQFDSNGNVYMYMFRVFASAAGGSDVRVLVKDGYDAAKLSDTAWHCELPTRPTGTINLRALCSSGAVVTTGPIDRQYLVNATSVERYIIVHRLMSGAMPGASTPLAGAAVFVKRAPNTDSFIGDNLVFGLPPIVPQ
jgi:hypothetical protein